MKQERGLMCEKFSKADLKMKKARNVSGPWELKAAHGL